MARSQIGQTAKNKLNTVATATTTKIIIHKAYLVINISNDYALAVKNNKNKNHKRTNEHKECEKEIQKEKNLDLL